MPVIFFIDFMTYSQAIDFLYSSLPAFESQGAHAYKPGLATSEALAELFGQPQNQYKIIHIAGTNGKGSTAHMLATILQLNGYKVGLYTSPHIIDFRERIRVDGEMIPEEYVSYFVEKYQNIQSGLTPTFFELTSTMAFSYFAAKKVDYAVIEVGLGGRLDSTNIVAPLLSIITNISLEHTSFLGNTIEEIAFEKGGIIKDNIPVVIGQAQPAVAQVFTRLAEEHHATIYFAEQQPVVTYHGLQGSYLLLSSTRYGNLLCDLNAKYQVANVNTVLTACEVLREKGVRVTDSSVIYGLKNVKRVTGLIGRWMLLQERPRVICDSGHNPGALEQVIPQLEHMSINSGLHIVLGVMADKELSRIMPLFPERATYYFAQADNSRALPAQQLHDKALQYGLKGSVYQNVNQAFDAALATAHSTDVVFVGGSMYVIGDVIARYPQ